MKQFILFFTTSLAFTISCQCQEMVAAADKFINLLDSNQQAHTLFPFDVDDRYNFYYFPVNDRKGIEMNELNDSQKQAAMDLLRSCLSDETVKKVNDIMALELILKTLENRKPEDHYRDPGKYYLTIFGVPANNTIWGWRFDGHHICLNFSAREKN